MDAVTRIRRVRADEGATLLALWKAADATPSPTDTLEDVERALASDRVACFVAEVGGQVVGSIIAAFDGWRGYMYRLAVHPSFRRRGMARRLVESAHESFARWGAKRITALVETDHPWAVSFWSAVGYVHDERMARFVKQEPLDTGEVRSPAMKHRASGAQVPLFPSPPRPRGGEG
jgi:ribosomal protein S18 acetylase RimI-like enzyme